MKSRLEKKLIQGTKMSNNRLLKLIRSVEVIHTEGQTIITPHEFCTECGCKEQTSEGNKVAYPEHFEKFHCARCHSLTAMIDNSPYTHVLSVIDTSTYNPKSKFKCSNNEQYW